MRIAETTGASLPASSIEGTGWYYRERLAMIRPMGSSLRAVPLRCGAFGARLVVEDAYWSGRRAGARVAAGGAVLAVTGAVAGVAA